MTNDQLRADGADAVKKDERGESPYTPAEEAQILACILRGMIEGGSVADPAVIYEVDYEAIDADVYVRRAATLLDEFARAASTQAALAATSAEPVAEVIRDGSDSMFKLSWLKPPGPHGTKLYAAPLTRQAATVPAGWKLVPIEPTVEMVSAARIAMSNYEADEYELKATAAIRSGVAHAPAAPASPADDSQAATAEPVDYDGVVSICEAHGIGLPVDCVEMVVEIIRHAAPLPRASDALKEAGDAVTLTGAQLAEALDFIAPDRDADQLETEATIQYGVGNSGKGTYCWITEYPEEGALLLDGTTVKAAQPVADDTGATCEWTHDESEYSWNTGCGKKWGFVEEGPKENGMNFCHACGGKLLIKSTDGTGVVKGEAE